MGVQKAVFSLDRIKTSTGRPRQQMPFSNWFMLVQMHRCQRLQRIDNIFQLFGVLPTNSCTEIEGASTVPAPRLFRPRRATTAQPPDAERRNTQNPAWDVDAAAKAGADLVSVARLTRGNNLGNFLPGHGLDHGGRTSQVGRVGSSRWSRRHDLRDRALTAVSNGLDQVVSLISPDTSGPPIAPSHRTRLLMLASALNE